MRGWLPIINGQLTLLVEEDSTPVDLPILEEDILQLNVKELQEQLNEAHIKIHKLHDVINEMKHLSQKSVDNLIKSVDISNKRWRD